MQLTLSHIADTLLQSSDIPLLTAFVLGILVALNPCQLAISVSALAYEYRNEKGMKCGIMYALGRAITYSLLGWVILCLIGGGRNIDGIRDTLSYAEAVVPYVLIVLGLYLLYRALFYHHHDSGDCHKSSRRIRRNGPLGSLLLGMTLALAFCPESAIFYFGMMIPLSISAHAEAIIPLIFALSASLPVVVIAWIMHKAISSAEHFTRHFERFQQWLNAITGILFIAIAVLMLI